MDKHTQAIRQQQQTNFFNVFGHFVELAFKRLMWKTTGNEFLEYLESEFFIFSKDCTWSLELPLDTLIPPWISVDHVTIFSSNPMQHLRWSSLGQKNRKCWKPLLTVVTESSLLNVAGLLNGTLKGIHRFSFLRQ